MPTYQWVSPTGHADPSATWVNPANAYDGNWGTRASCSGHEANDFTYYLQLNLAALMYVDRVRFKYNLLPIESTMLSFQIDIWNEEKGAWDNVFNETAHREEQIEVIIPTTYTNRLRARGMLSGIEVWLYEVEVERVTPDLPAPPPPPTIPEPKNPPNLPEVYQTEKKETKGQPPHGTARIRTLHRITRIAPWIV